MDRYVCDTHALFWHLTSSPRLGVAARAVFERADRGDAVIVIPAIVWFELYHLNEKFKIGLDVVSELRLVRDAAGYECPPMEPEHIAEFGALSGVPEMHDRMIAAVARRLILPCLTRDPAIRESGLVSCIWSQAQ